MGTYLMIVQSRAKPGRDAEYNRWYETTHKQDICAVPGVKSVRRYEASPVHVGSPGLRFLAIYEVETDDPAGILTEIGKRVANGTIRSGEANDAGAAIMWFYKAQ